MAIYKAHVDKTTNTMRKKIIVKIIVKQLSMP